MTYFGYHLITATSPPTNQENESEMSKTTNTLLIAVAVAAAGLLTGCAADPNARGDTSDDASHTPLGTYIARKGPARGDNVTRVDKQALENDRAMGSASINLPGNNH